MGKKQSTPYLDFKFVIGVVTSPICKSAIKATFKKIFVKKRSEYMIRILFAHIPNGMMSDVAKIFP